MGKQAKTIQTGNYTSYSILITIGLCHLLNDSLQAVIPAMFPILEQSLGLSFTQLGLIAFTLNMVASIMQPVVGTVADKRPMPYALPIGLTSSMIGMFALAFAPSFGAILICVVFIGLGSAIFHPEGSRVAFLAAGPRRGLAQSIYQVGGNTGQALAPLITALVLVPLGQFGAIWFTLVAALAVFFLMKIARWYAAQVKSVYQPKSTDEREKVPKARTRNIRNALIVLVFIVFARSWYQSAIGNFYAFYAMETYGLKIAGAQIYIFTFLLMGAVGTFFGGPIADKIGKRNVILLSFLVPAPLAILMPHVGAVLSLLLLGVIGFLIMSSFSVTIVYAQELVPGKIGTMAGLIGGLAFGMGAIGAVVLGSFIDSVGLTPTMIAISAFPLLGCLTFLLPSDKRVESWYETT